MDFLLFILRIKKKYAYKKYLKHWKQRYHVRLLKKARITIRFGFRNYYGKYAWGMIVLIKLLMIMMMMMMMMMIRKMMMIIIIIL